MKQPADQISLLTDDLLDELVEEIDDAPTPPEARDDVTAFREFHGWTLDKLDVFEKYLKLYRRVAGSGAFIDAFAGSGLGFAVQRGQQARRPGSALLAAQSGAFATIDLIESKDAVRATLTSVIDDLAPKVRERIRVHGGDCNKILPELLQDEDRFDPARPCFVQLDQESTQLNWDTVERLASWKQYIPPPQRKGRPKSCKVELWILFNSYQVMTRLWPHDRERYPDSFSPSTLDRVFGGSDAWRDLWDEGANSNQLVLRYADRLRSLGYVYVVPQTIKDPASGRPQYHMLHATDHPSALSLMRWARRASSGYENTTLPGIEG